MGYQSGYVVQSNAPSKFCSTNGCGLGDKVSWPLEGSGIQNQIEESWVENFFAQSPAQMIHYELIFEEALLMEYLHECQKAGLNVRVIYLKHCDCSDAPPQQAQFLGCDLLYPSVPYYSALLEERDDVLRSGLAAHLNSNGLFDTSSHLREFIDWRRANVKGDGTDGEPLAEMIPAELYLYKNFDGLLAQ